MSTKNKDHVPAANRKAAMISQFDDSIPRKDESSNRADENEYLLVYDNTD